MSIYKHKPISFFIFCLSFTCATIYASESNTLQVGGTIQVDATYINDDTAELIPGSGTEVRRARLYIEGQHDENWKYKLRVGFEENNLSVKDAYMNNSDTGLKIGLFKPPFSIDEMTSSKFITFMEQALPNAFKPGRRIGVAYHRYTNKINFNAGIFGQGSADGDSGDEGFGASTRITSPVIQTNSQLMHLGFNLSIENPEDDTNNSVSFDARPESHITDNIVDTGTISNIDNIIRSGIEFSFVKKSFSIQAETITVQLTKNDNSNDLVFNGSYIYASWFITGEQRPYKASKGTYGRIIPINASTGAWELAARFSDINLNDDIINGGEASNTTIGINWYSTKKTRFSMNFIHVKTNKNNIYGNPDILQLRAQIDF